VLCSSRMAFSNEANAELKTLNGKTQEVAKNKKKRKSLQTSLNPVASGALIHGLGTSIEQSW